MTHTIKVKGVWIRQRKKGKQGKQAYIMVAQPDEAASAARCWVIVTEKQSPCYLEVANEIKEAIEEGCIHMQQMGFEAQFL